MSKDFSDESIKSELLDCYVNFDNFFWDYCLRESREDVKLLYIKIMNLNHQGYSKLIQGKLYEAALLIKGSMDCFEVLQNKLYQKL